MGVIPFNKDLPMSKAERLGLMIAMLTLIVAVGAWLFPAKNPALTLIYQDEARNLTNEPSNIKNTQNTTSRELDNRTKPHASNEPVSPLLTEISLHLFISQLKGNTLDSGKLSYISKNRDLLKEKVPFYELNNILSLITLDSNKIDAARLLIGQASSPSEDDVQVYAELFTLGSNRRTALALVYGK